MPLEHVIRRLTSETARAIGLTDRGVIAPGYRADLNVIDIKRLAVGKLTRRRLPNGGERIRQRASGYAATIVAGKAAYRRGYPTGVLPGRFKPRCEKRSLKSAPGSLLCPSREK